MIQQWEKVYIFIGSTFNDMHPKRDYLIKQVFPQLREWCASCSSPSPATTVRPQSSTPLQEF